MEKIKKELFKIMREIREMEARGEFVKRDPLEVLNEFAEE